MKGIGEEANKKKNDMTTPNKKKKRMKLSEPKSLADGMNAYKNCLKLSLSAAIHTFYGMIIKMDETVCRWYGVTM